MDMFSPRRTTASHDDECEEIDCLHGITPLGPRTTEELDAIGKKVNRHLCIARPSDRVPRRFVFVVKAGTLEASITGESGIRTVVGRLNLEIFFDEMSLLFGAPRSATVAPSIDSVVFEITRSDLEPLMMRHLAMADQLSDVLAERQLRNMRLLDEEKGADALEIQMSLSRQFLGRIQTFFGLGHCVRDGELNRSASS
jgi:CRP-like cAMP-binding protein